MRAGANEPTLWPSRSRKRHGGDAADRRRVTFGCGTYEVVGTDGLRRGHASTLNQAGDIGRRVRSPSFQRERGGVDQWYRGVGRNASKRHLKHFVTVLAAQVAN